MSDMSMVDILIPLRLRLLLFKYLLETWPREMLIFQDLAIEA